MAKDFELVESALSRTRGLMFRCGVKKPLLFVFEGTGRKRRTIHSLFVSFPFSAIFLDDGKRVVDVRVAEPFISFITPKKPCRYLIEGSPGLAKEVRVGDVLEFNVR